MPHLRSSRAARARRKGTDSVRGAWRPAASAGLLLAAVVATSAGGLTAPFLFDDEYSIRDNPFLHTLSWGTLFRAMPQSAAAGRPVVTLTLALNRWLGGFDVRGFHAFNIALHAASAVVLWAWAQRTLCRPPLADRFGAAAPWLALAIALVWAVHPLQSEAVVYIIQRTELLMGLFYLLVMYCALRAWDSPRPLPWQAAAVICCGLGMASKEVMASAPLMVALYDRAFLCATWGAALARRGRFYAALASTWLILAGLIGTAPRGASVGLNLRTGPLEYAMTQCWAILHYLRLAVWPAGFCIDYGEGTVTAPGSVAAGAGVIAVLAAATVWGWLRRPPWGFLGAWFFLILAPSSSVVPIVTEVAAERRMYLPLAAVAAAVVVGGRLAAQRWLGRRADAWACGAVVLAAGLLAVLAHRHACQFTDPVALWQAAAQLRPDNARAQHNLGKALYERSRLAEAVEAYDRALAARPDYAEAWNHRGAALAQMGRAEEAIAAYEQALQCMGNYANARNNLAITLEALGRRDEAEAQYLQALNDVPHYVEGRTNYAILLARAGRQAEAQRQFRIALEQMPAYAPALNGLGALLGRDASGLAEAAECFRRATAADPTRADAWGNWIEVLTRQRRLAEALSAADAAVRAVPGSSRLWNARGVVLGPLGRVEEAAACFEQALKLDPQNAAAYRNLASVRMQQGRVAEAAAPLEAARRLAPGDAEVQELYRRWRAAQPLQPAER